MDAPHTAHRDELDSVGRRARLVRGRARARARGRVRVRGRARVRVVRLGGAQP